MVFFFFLFLETPEIPKKLQLLLTLDFFVYCNDPGY